MSVRLRWEKIIAGASDICSGFSDVSYPQAHDQGRLDIGSAVGWGGPSLQAVQPEGKIMDQLGPQGVLSSSAPQGSASRMTVNPAFSPSDELYSQSKVQDHLPYATSFPPEQVQDNMVAQEQNTTTQTASLQHVRAERKKKEG
jgi:hypothetical protein